MKKTPKNHLPFGCLGAISFFVGLFIALGILSGEAKKNVAALWILVFLFLGFGGGGLFAAWKVWKKEKAFRPAPRPAAPIPSPLLKQPASPPGEVCCPSCGHSFVPPKITLVTEAVVKRFGPNPVQCPDCKRIWGRS